MESDEDIYHAVPQLRGKIAHQSIDQKSYSTSKNEITALKVYSKELGVYGVIDLFRVEQKLLIERKFQLRRIHQGQLYQLWAQYFCLSEMGYLVERLAFYETSTNRMFPVELPKAAEKNNLIDIICSFREYTPEKPLLVNSNKCIHCIYCNLCDKTNRNNVYT